MSKASVVARIQVTVEFTVGVWNDDMTFAELRDVAKREGLQKIRTRMQSESLRIIGDPVFSGITGAEES